MTDDQVEPLDLSGGERKLVTQPYDLPVSGISRDIEAGRIKLAIEYQRKYVWDTGKASRLIESLLLNVPIPVCYFAEDSDGVYEVIDGLQRLQTIKNFVDGELALSGVSVLSELEGFRFDDLAAKDQRRLQNRTVRCIVITEDSHPDIKFDVFERLNTGAAALSAQELRNAVYRGPFNDQLKKLARDSNLLNLTGSMKNSRMEIEELLLRFFALHAGIETYKPPLRQALNSYMRANRSGAPSAQDIGLFENTCMLVAQVLGPLPFKAPESNNAVNRALFDAVMLAFSRADQEELMDSRAQVAQAFASLFADEAFVASIGRATADKSRMNYRIGAVARLLRGNNVSVDLPAEFGATE
ncbi:MULTISPECIES: DUF262 domain-containing protein [unclassified Pseudoclavibacter]|uniref:DUF262 domain-containing protein n=1 Tax=unclassified Pseudoclavibacter TaxID=2615177 RepID=UPI001BAAF399|nr:DUF262 domain-containing protein [Pseudoclavibacter sp. Marseille-Q4354]MBS3179906.1 DUF262 domain-containing protein [Pseudoclavibacter sp. Marseille-Q4354]